ncbi:MAG: hypothetical protein IM638_06865 [Bacteroidetes bacterium]|nr:hypothetical protein [Bacteroidota bacterium]
MRVLFPHLAGSLVIMALLLLGSCLRRQTGERLPPPPLPTAETSDNQCYLNGTLSFSQRLQRAPFSEKLTVRLISFSKYMIGVKALVKDSVLQKQYVIDNIILDSVKTDSLTNVLYNYNYSPKTTLIEEVQYGCYEPRHAILFEDSRGRVKYYFECCLECRGFKSNLPDSVWGTFCTGKYELLQSCFAYCGVKYFGPGEPK